MRLQVNTEANAHTRRAAATNGERQRQKHQYAAARDDPSRAAADDVAVKARQLWAADRVAGRLARAVNLVRDGKAVKDPELLLAAIEKYKDVIYDTNEKMAERCSRLAAKEARRRNAMEAERTAQEDREASWRASKQEAEAARATSRTERESKRAQRAAEIIDAKRTRELTRRNREVEELVEREWTREQQHLHTCQSREAQRRENARAVQEREHWELVRSDEARRLRRVDQLETEQTAREAADPQVIKALPGSVALLGGHKKNIAPYAQQHRQHLYHLSRWQHPE